MNMNSVSGAAAKLLGGDRQELAVRALARSESTTDLADESRGEPQVRLAQSLRASTALTEAFSVAANDEEKVLFEWVATPRRLEQMVLSLVLMRRASHRGVMEFLHGVMGWSDLVVQAYPHGRQLDAVDDAADHACRRFEHPVNAVACSWSVSCGFR